MVSRVFKNIRMGCLWKSYFSVDGCQHRISIEIMIKILKSRFCIYEAQDSRFIQIRIGLY